VLISSSRLERYRGYPSSHRFEVLRRLGIYSRLSEKIPQFFRFFFVPSLDLLDDCSSQETEGGKLLDLLVAIFMVVFFNSDQWSTISFRLAAET
jgi:hypothetical protein